MDAAHGIEGSTVVTAMARNGVDFGIRVSGTGDAWFTAPADGPDGLYFPGYGPADANPDLGDSAITETRGIGGFAMAAAPAIVRFVGGTPDDALGYTREMQRITLARDADFALPPLGLRRHADGHRPAPGRRDAAPRRSSTPASPTASRASGRSAPGSRERRWPVSRTALREVGRRLGVAASQEVARRSPAPAPERLGGEDVRARPAPSSPSAATP